MWLDGKDLNISPTRLRSERFAIGFLPGARCPRKDYAGDAAEDSSNPKPSTAKYRSSGRFINNEGILAGLEGSEPFVDGRGFRFDPRTGEVMLLDPVSPDK